MEQFLILLTVAPLIILLWFITGFVCLLIYAVIRESWK